MPAVLVLSIIIILLIGAVFISPFILAFIGGLVWYHKWKTSPARQETEYRELTLKLYNEVKASFEPKEVRWILKEPFLSIANELLKEEMVAEHVPPPPAICNSIEGARYRDRLAKMGGTSTDDLNDAIETITESLRPFVVIHGDAEEAIDFEEDISQIPISYFIDNLNVKVLQCMAPFYRSDRFVQLKRQLDRNMENVKKGDRYITPPDYTGEDVVGTYLSGTPLKKLFNVEIPFAIPDKYRMEHHFILAGTGHGKTVSMQYYITKDIERAIDGEISLIVMDSQGDLIEKVRRLEGLNGDNCIIIDPEDVEYPVSLNLFDVKTERLDNYSPLARERQLNGIIELYDYILGSLLSAEMTQKQSVLFRYVARLLLMVPNSTIHTMLDLFQDGALERYEEYIDQLDPVAQMFFRTEFTDREFNQTRRQVTRRLYGILENQAFTRMFSNPRSKLDLFAEMNAGKIILINTAKSLLKEEGTEIFGRFFLAMITQAAQEREELPEEDRKPCFVYVDEANDYGFDDKIDLILTQARKYRVGLTMATQYLDKITPRLQSAIASNTSIKFAGGTSHQDARRMAPDMRCDADFIEYQPTLSFACYVRGLTPRAVPLKFEAGYMERMPKATSEELAELLNANRARYADHIGSKPPPNHPEPDDTPPDEPVEGDGFEMAESVPEEERMEKPKPKTNPDNVDEHSEW